MTAYQHGDARSAIDKLSRAIQSEYLEPEPDKRFLSEIYNIRGEAYLLAKAMIRSRQDFYHSLALHPMNENALNNLGVWHSLELFKHVNHTKALQFFDQAVELAPERQDILFNRAIVRIRAGNWMGFEDLKKLELEKYTAACTALHEYGED